MVLKISQEIQLSGMILSITFSTCAVKLSEIGFNFSGLIAVELSVETKGFYIVSLSTENNEFITILEI